MTDLQEVTLETLAGGAVPELFAREMAAVLRNIEDPNTLASAKRKITLEIAFHPQGEGREMAGVTVAVKSSLAGVLPVSTGIYITSRNGKLVALGKNPRQEELELGNIRVIRTQEAMDAE